jgi:glutathione synthase/RimK-type ligase-like ATP-grasp enzyme
VSASTSSFASATRAAARVAFVTCAELLGLDPDDQLLRDALVERGQPVDALAWDDPAVDWRSYDLVVLRSPWDYPPRRADFVAWAQSVPNLANPAAVVAWNTDKRYLAELADAGVSVVQTDWVQPGGDLTGIGGSVVVKPNVGAGSIDTGRYELSDPAQRKLAEELIGRIHGSGRVAMVQPYLDAVDTYGETSLIYLDGEYSHAIRKGPILSGPDEGTDGLYKAEEIRPREPLDAERALAGRVLEALPFDTLLYARVDLVPGRWGEPVLLELELTEPSLFLGTAPGAADRLAGAIERRVQRR